MKYILSLDGGGVKGLTTIVVLKEIENPLEEDADNEQII